MFDVSRLLLLQANVAELVACKICPSLHFASGVAEAKCIFVTRVCMSVCLPLAAFPHYCTDADATWGNGIAVLYSCALLNGFAIGARVSLL